MSERYGSRERNYLRGRPRSREDARSEPTCRAQPRCPEAAGVQKGGRRGGCTAPGFCRLSREATLGAVVTTWSGRRTLSLGSPPGYSTVRCCSACCTRCRWPRYSLHTVVKTRKGRSERKHERHARHKTP